ncbi:hypothetical protein D9619_012207 [Psilocybe cf. subviscida]|uniref:Uncharacterized protein n=1 Tax=Psilocybe cf. subviscida TaxID=2480587 RepID=A0A8H5B708_9AGAR|nr:hypothetical protein D9619_012207 [Psilocybe cf. subviscida]
MPNIKTLWNKFRITASGAGKDRTINATTIKDIGGCNNADLNNGTSKAFVEVDHHDKDDVLLSLSKANVVTIIHLANDIGPVYGYGGLGWQDLFAERTEWRKARWVPIKFVKMMSAKNKTNDDCMFRLWLCLPGLIHVEVDDDGTWTVEEIVGLPEWIIIG